MVGIWNTAGVKLDPRNAEVKAIFMEHTSRQYSNMTQYREENSFIVGWYCLHAEYISSTSQNEMVTNLKDMLDKFETIFEAIAFPEEETINSEVGSPQSLWMGRLSGFICNFAKIEDLNLAKRLLKII